MAFKKLIKRFEEKIVPFSYVIVSMNFIDHFNKRTLTIIIY